MAKKKKAYLPKRIAGMKVPRSVRRGSVGKFLASPLGKAIIAEGAVVAGAGAVAAANSDKIKRGLRRVEDGAGRAMEGASDTTSRLTDALTQAARTFAEAMRRPDEERAWSAEPESSTVYGQDASSKKKPRSPGELSAT